MANDPRTCDTDDVKFIDWNDVVWAQRSEIGRLGVITDPTIESATTERTIEAT